MEDIHKQPKPCKLTTNFTTSLRAAPLKKMGLGSGDFFASLVILHVYKVSPTVIKCSPGEEAFNLSRGTLYNNVNTEMNMYSGQKSVHIHGF